MISSSVRNLRTSHEQNNTGGQNISNKPQPLPLLFPNETAELTHVLSGSLAKYNQKRQDAVQAAKPKGPWHKTPSKKVQDIIRKYFPTPVDPKRKFHALKPKCPAGEQGTKMLTTSFTSTDIMLLQVWFYQSNLWGLIHILKCQTTST